MTPDKDPPLEMLELSISVSPEELSKILPPERSAPPTEEEIEVSRDMEWALNNPEVQQRYPDMIVAVYRRKVVAAGGDWGKVLEEAERVTGFPGNHIAVVGVIGPSILEH
jgi:hypothetical protein